MIAEPLRILHLEDNAYDANLIQAALTKSGFACIVQVITTRDQFLSTLASSQFDLILSDSSIPGYSGLSALEAARKLYPDIPFIFVSGHPVIQPPEHLQAAAAVEYVSKARLDTLTMTIKHVLQTSTVMPQSARNPTEQLINVVQELSLARDLATVVAIVRRAARALTGADGATFVLREQGLCYYADEDAIAPLWKGKRFPMSACISGWAMLNKQSAVIEDIYSDSRIPADAYRPTFVKSLAMVPIRIADPVGAIGNYWAVPHKATSEELKLLQALANSTAIAMENVQLYSELEYRVQERTAQLEAANKELQTFSYSVSHDLQAPLRHIDGFSQLLLEKAAGQLDDANREYLQHIRRSTKRMSQLVDDLLQLSRIAQAEVVKKSVNLTRIAKEVAGALQATAPSRQIELTFEEEVFAHGDLRLLRVVLENLFANAWKYTSKTPQPRIQFGARYEEPERPIYYIKDNGVGFDMAYADKLFGAFQRLHAESEFPGNGVGLATVQRIIHKHGGRIWAESSLGEGATFYFSVPAMK